MITINQNGKQKKFRFFITAMIYCWWNDYDNAVVDLGWYWKTNATEVQIWLPNK